MFCNNVHYVWRHLHPARELHLVADHDDHVLALEHLPARGVRCRREVYHSCLPLLLTVPLVREHLPAVGWSREKFSEKTREVHCFTFLPRRGATWHLAAVGWSREVYLSCLPLLFTSPVYLSCLPLLFTSRERAPASRRGELRWRWRWRWRRCGEVEKIR